MLNEKDVEYMVRGGLRHMKAYTPVDPIDLLTEKAVAKAGETAKLDGNENPYGCSPRVQKALSEYKEFNRYPDPAQREVRKALAKYTGAKPESIVAGAGSDDLIDIILRLFLEPGDKVINCPPTFGMYPFCTDIAGGIVTKVPRKGDFSLDIPAIKKAADKNTKVIFIASPNNPSGNQASKDEIKELLGLDLIVVVDEAYVEFSGNSMLGMVPLYANLIVLRTFSKWAGIAGLRAGYGVCPCNIVPYMMKIKQPYNVNLAAQVAILESLEDVDYLQKTVKAMVAEREVLYKGLKQFKWLKPYPSVANFILCAVLDRSAKDVYLGLQKRGIFIRYFETPELKDYIRISVGRPEDTVNVIAALKDM
ncbi:MAG: histidinol-phosphate transaminase [Chloroflexi bacterium]|nr:histidinol-phosphate transaminase [Chloroflexota bacterium]